MNEQKQEQANNDRMYLRDLSLPLQYILHTHYSNYQNLNIPIPITRKRVHRRVIQFWLMDQCFSDRTSHLFSSKRMMMLDDVVYYYHLTYVPRFMPFWGKRILPRAFGPLPMPRWQHQWPPEGGGWRERCGDREGVLWGCGDKQRGCGSRQKRWRRVSAGCRKTRRVLRSCIIGIVL